MTSRPTPGDRGRPLAEPSCAAAAAPRRAGARRARGADPAAAFTCARCCSAFAGLLDLLRRAERRSDRVRARLVLRLRLISWSGCTGSRSRSSPMPSGSARSPSPAVLLLCACMACYPALAAWLDAAPSLAQPDRRGAGPGARLDRRRGGARRPVRRLSLEPDRLCLRAVDAISQLAALTGIYGLSLLAVALGALPVVWLEPERTRALAAARRGRPDPRPDLGRRRGAAGRMP